MTCILAVAAEGHVYMAADSATFIDDRPVTVGKLLRVPLPEDLGTALLGFSGDGALPRIWAVEGKILDSVDPPADSGDADRWAQEVASMLTHLAVGNGLVDHEDRDRMDAEVLLGWHGQVWTLVHHQAIPHFDRTAAIGAGGPIALGAFTTLRDNVPDLPPRTAVELAVKVACRLNVWCREPVDVMSVGQPS